MAKQNAIGVPADVSIGGTGATSHTAYAVLTGGTTGTGAVQSIASVGTSGQALVSNGAGALPSMQTLNLQGEPAPTTVNTISLFSDFMSAISVEHPFVTSSVVKTSAGNANKNNPGMLVFSASDQIGLDNVVASSDFLGGGEITMTMYGSMDGTVPTDSADKMFFGMHDGTGIGSANRVGFYFDPSVTAANWNMSTANASSTTNTDTGTAMTNSGTFQVLKLVINAAGTSAEFFIDGSSEGTQSTNFPATTSQMRIGMSVLSWPASYNLDYMGYNQVMTGDRS